LSCGAILPVLAQPVIIKATVIAAAVAIALSFSACTVSSSLSG